EPPLPVTPAVPVPPAAPTVPAAPLIPAVPVVPAVPVRWPDDPPQFEDRTTSDSAPPAATSADTLRALATVFRMLVVLSVQSRISSRFLAEFPRFAQLIRASRPGRRRPGGVSRRRRHPAAAPPGWKPRRRFAAPRRHGRAA